MSSPAFQFLVPTGLRVRKFLQILGLCFVILPVIFGALFLGIHIASRQEPQFYRHALEQEAGEEAEAGDQLEQRVLTLHNETRRTGNWQATFTDSQINGWLASDLTEKFSGVLPPEFQNPRVSIESGRALLACGYTDPPIQTVLSMEVDVHLTEQPNVIAIQIHKARAGKLPVPLVRVLNVVSVFARRAEIDLKWMQFEGDPVAELTIPDHREEMKTLLHLEALELHDGKIYLAGRTEATKESGTQNPAAENIHNVRSPVQFHSKPREGLNGIGSN